MGARRGPRCIAIAPSATSHVRGDGLVRPDEGLVEAIRKLLVASPFHGEGHRKVWARLRFAGIRTPSAAFCG